MLVIAWLAEEGEENQAEHVERSEASADQAEQPEPDVGAGSGARGFENFVLAEKSGETWDAGDRERRDKHAPECNRDFVAQAAHVRHFLVAAHGVNHAAGGEKQQAFEKRVSHQVKYAGG